MDRMACVNVPALPLQLLLAHHPDWRKYPTVVVNEDKPQGLIQWANRHAQRCRILSGMRYAAGLSLSHELRAGTVSDQNIQQATNKLMHQLFCFSPDIEPSTSEPGLFWLDVSGLLHLYSSPTTWANSVHADVLRSGLHAIVIVGFSRFGTYAAARSSRYNLVFSNPAEEQTYLRKVSIDTIGFAPKQRNQLTKLGIHTMGAFMNLPPDSIHHRFGAEVNRIYQRIHNDIPLTPDPMRESPTRFLFFDVPENQLTRLLPSFTQHLQSICFELSQQGQLLACLHLLLIFEDSSKKQEKITPSAPTLDTQQLLSLLRLRLESLCMNAGVVEVHLQGTGTPATHHQIDLFCDAPRRDSIAIHQAFARLRARFGNDIVVVAHLCDAYLPEARYQWRSVQHIPTPKPSTCLPPTTAWQADLPIRPLVRRIYNQPTRLSRRNRYHPNNWLPVGSRDGLVEEVVGPYHISTEWWAQEHSRAYHYIRTKSQRWLWTYYDKQSGRWFLQGEVE